MSDEIAPNITAAATVTAICRLAETGVVPGVYVKWPNGQYHLVRTSTGLAPAAAIDASNLPSLDPPDSPDDVIVEEVVSFETALQRRYAKAEEEGNVLSCLDDSNDYGKNASFIVQVDGKEMITILDSSSDEEGDDEKKKSSSKPAAASTKGSILDKDSLSDLSYNDDEDGDDSGDDEFSYCSKCDSDCAVKGVPKRAAAPAKTKTPTTKSVPLSEMMNGLQVRRSSRLIAKKK
ncbi:hypothetical protein MPSEU_000985100 [Mayamaea pseudoterrestris]|nr:hypothetical protein MPSEU_000985100 [Mayamaea pseudoterrestris]